MRLGKQTTQSRRKPKEFIWDGDGMGIGLRRQVADNLKGQPIEQNIFRGSEGADYPDALYIYN